jgi:hypothetical protein
MAEVKTPPVRALPVDFDVTMDAGLDALKASAGGFEFYADSSGALAGMFMICPCGCGKTGALAFKPAPSPSWNWNGDREKPTLTPSVHDRGHWHGHLTDGVWVSC